MKTRRTEMARQAKLEYYRLYTRARRDALRDLGLQLVGHQIHGGEADAGEASPRSGPPIPVIALRPVPLVEHAHPVVDNLPPVVVREVIDVSLSDYEAGLENTPVCPICPDEPAVLITPQSCSHGVCSDCLSGLYARALQSGIAARCCICRVALVI
ncbi:DNA binding protein [Phytophthora megakarya]|uniref:DNA binding protein n=1 Tax=Phytophthora megakarya TaxID=4795 RepID=A0A225V4X9_9STRA|nr:DNA binding protein [Phytophthora megakarya]